MPAPQIPELTLRCLRHRPASPIGAISRRGPTAGGHEGTHGGARWQQRHWTRTNLDAAAIRDEFPILARPAADGRPLIFLDSAASSQKPAAVIDALCDYYRTANANVHRGVYHLSELATNLYEEARHRVAGFINAASPRECVFVRNTTEAINLVAQTWGRQNIRAGDLIVLSIMEHHSNLVPWQVLAEERGAEIAYIPLTEDHRLDLEAFEHLLEREPKLVAVTQVSNTLGTINDVAAIVRAAHAVGATVLIDGAQSVPHLPVDVQALDVDFLAFSGHKMLGPMGVGVLYGKRALLEAMPPYMFGGSMIRKVGLEHSTWADVPAKFEAGTPAVGDAIGLGAAVEYLSKLGDRPRPGPRARDRRICPGTTRRGAWTDRLRPGGPFRSAAASSPSRWPTSTPTTSPRSWTARTWRSGPATTARSH